MGLEPISIKNMEEKTNDLYEAVVVMSKKAKQVINERTIEKLMRVSDQTEMGVFDDEENINPEDYEELTKPTTVAVDSFVSGDLEWTKKSSESDSFDSDSFGEFDSESSEGLDGGKRTDGGGKGTNGGGKGKNELKIKFF